MTPDQKMEREGDKWFYDLGVMGERVTRNNEDLRRTDETLRRYGVSNRLLALLTLAGLMLLAFRMEAAFDAQRDISYDNCLGSRGVIEKFNNQQRDLAELDREALARAAKTVPDSLEARDIKSARERRIAAYESGYIPVPKCDKP